jgi:hypothetical protein
MSLSRANVGALQRAVPCRMCGGPLLCGCLMPGVPYPGCLQPLACPRGWLEHQRDVAPEVEHGHPRRANVGAQLGGRQGVGSSRVMAFILTCTALHPLDSEYPTGFLPCRPVRRRAVGARTGGPKAL